MKALILFLSSCFIVGSLQANSGDSMKEADQIIQQLPKQPDIKTPAQTQSVEEAEAAMHKQAQEIEQKAESFQKHYNNAEKEPQPSDPLPQPRKLGCLDLPIEEQSFAAELDPEHQKAFCKTFTAEQRKIAMMMKGKFDKDGNLITPNSAVEFVAKENGVAIPKSPYELENELPHSVPPVKEN